MVGCDEHLQSLASACFRRNQAGENRIERLDLSFYWTETRDLHSLSMI